VHGGLIRRLFGSLKFALRHFFKRTARLFGNLWKLGIRRSGLLLHLKWHVDREYPDKIGARQVLACVVCRAACGCGFVAGHAFLWSINVRPAGRPTLACGVAQQRVVSDLPAVAVGGDGGFGDPVFFCPSPARSRGSFACTAPVLSAFLPVVRTSSSSCLVLLCSR
jgi:hypothetical protein